MKELRHFIDQLRDHYDLPYPLAHHQPYVSGRELVYEAQNAAGLGSEYALVAFASNQLVLTPASQSFLDRSPGTTMSQLRGARQWILARQCSWMTADSPRSL